MNNQPKPPIFVRPLLFLSGNGKYLKIAEWVLVSVFLIILFVIIGYDYKIWGLYIGLSLIVELWFLSAKKWISNNK